jgi:hypothetical protein
MGMHLSMGADFEVGNGEQSLDHGIMLVDPFSRHEKCRRNVVGDQEVDQIVIDTRCMFDRTEVIRQRHGLAGRRAGADDLSLGVRRHRDG